MCLYFPKVCSLLSLGFTVVFSTFLLGFVDWEKLLTCHDEQSCHKVEDYITTKHIGFSSLYSFITLSYIILFGSYWLWSCFNALQIISQAMEMEVFYR
jgi:autophagy-related protein 9